MAMANQLKKCWNNPLLKAQKGISTLNIFYNKKSAECQFLAGFEGELVKHFNFNLFSLHRSMQALIILFLMSPLYKQ